MGAVQMMKADQQSPEMGAHLRCALQPPHQSKAGQKLLTESCVLSLFPGRQVFLEGQFRFFISFPASRCAGPTPGLPGPEMESRGLPCSHGSAVCEVSCSQQDLYSNAIYKSKLISFLVMMASWLMTGLESGRSGFCMPTLSCVSTGRSFASFLPRCFLSVFKWRGKKC